MEYLHTMVRVTDLDASLNFFCSLLGLVEVRRREHEKGRFTLVFLAAPGDAAAAKETQRPTIELTYNWDPEDYTGGRNFGHLAYGVDDIYAEAKRLSEAGVEFIRQPEQESWGGWVATFKDPDGNVLQLLQLV